MLGLLIQPSICSDEGLQGYLIRLADANALSGQEVRQYFKSQSESGITYDKHPVFWQSIREQLTSSIAIPMPLWNTRSRRFCPICLGDEPYWRACWELALVTECHVHKVGLVQKCPCCHEDLSWICSRIEECGSCGASLFIAKPSEPLEAALWISEELSRRLLYQKTANIHTLDSLSLEDFYAIALRLGARRSEAGQLKPLKVKDSASLEVARRIARAASSFLYKWPDGFRLNLEDLLEKSGQRYWLLQKSLGLIYQDVFSHLENPCYDFVRHEFESVIAENWTGPINRRNKSLSKNLTDSHIWIPVKKASSYLGLCESLIRRMVAEGDVPSQKHRSNSGRVSTLVNWQYLYFRKSKLTATISLEEAANRLAIPEKRVRELLKSNELSFLGGEPGKGERWWIEENSFEGLIKIGSKLCKYENAPSNSRTLAFYYRHHLPAVEIASNILRMIVSHEIKPIGRLSAPDAIGHWLFSSDDVIALKRKLNPSEMMSVQECASELEIKEQVAYELVRLGLIKCNHSFLGESSIYRIERKAIESFTKEYIFGRDIALQAGTSPKCAAHYLLNEGYLPVAGPRVKGAECRQYVWKRSQQIALLFNKALIMRVLKTYN